MVRRGAALLVVAPERMTRREVGGGVGAEGSAEGGATATGAAGGVAGGGRAAGDTGRAAGWCVVTVTTSRGRALKVTMTAESARARLTIASA